MLRFVSLKEGRNEDWAIYVWHVGPYHPILPEVVHKACLMSCRDHTKSRCG